MNERKLVSFDYAMKYLLRQKDNFDILEGFLTDLLGFDVIVVEILESESNKIAEIDKGNRVDLIIKDQNNQRIAIEIQYAPEQDYLERIIWETSRIIIDNLEQGKQYKDVIKVISVSILYFNIGEGEDYIFKGETLFKGLSNQNAVLKYDVDKFPEYYLIRTKKFNDVVKTPLDEWIYMFKNDEVRENATAKNINKAKEKLALLKMSKEERKKYEAFIRAQTINKSILDTAINQGIAIGLKRGEKEGKKEGKKEGIAIGVERGKKKGQKEGIAIGVERGKKEAQLNIAKKLFHQKMDIDMICQITGLSLEDLKLGGI